MVHASLRLPTRPTNPALVPDLSCRAETEIFSPSVIYIRRVCNSQQRIDLLAAEDSILYYRFRAGPFASIDPIDSRMHIHALLLKFRVVRLFIPQEARFLHYDIFCSLSSSGSIKNLSVGFEAQEGSVHLPFLTDAALIRNAYVLNEKKMECITKWLRTRAERV